MDRISVVINTLNEEKNIERAIKSTKSFADEVVVVDMFSEDKTAKIAKKMGARVYHHERTGYVEPARNFAIEQANGDWIFILDADEEVPATLGKKLKKIVANPKSDYYAIPRKNMIFGKWVKHSRWWPDYNIRFFKKGKVYWDKNIHSVPITEGKGMDLKPKEKFAIKHFHYDTTEQFIERMNRYTSVQARELYYQNHKFHWRDLIHKPTREFISRYFAAQGYKDGLHGLVLASLQATSELVLYIKVWQLEKFSDHKVPVQEVIQEYKSAQREMNYWFADTLYNTYGGFIQKVRRKLKI